MKMLLLVVFFSFWNLSISCPENCFCELYSAECYIRDCSDQLFTEVDYLVIHGSLCENHKFILTHIQDVQVLLKDSVCESIPNCR